MTKELTSSRRKACTRASWLSFPQASAANAEIARMNGFTVDRAIVVNDRMETNYPDIFACGDCAQYNGVNFALWSEAEAAGELPPVPMQPEMTCTMSRWTAR
jgi:hypothetical protein